MAEVYGMRAAKASPEDVNEMRDFLFELEEMLGVQDDEAVGEFINLHFRSRCGRHFQRILFGYDTLVENACDPELNYLEWKPEIKAAIEAAQEGDGENG